MRIVNLLHKLFLCTFLLFFFSCENKITAPERVVSQPGKVDAQGNNNSIKVEFFGNNIEEGFRGYNVYISSTPGIKNQSLVPVKNKYGLKPTLIYGFTGCFADASQKSYITVTKDSLGRILVNSQNYYVAVSTYLLIGDKEYESILTEEVLVNIKVKNTNTMNNQQVSGNTNEGIVFNDSGICTNINIPDNIVSGSTGDLFFKLENVNGTVLPVISVESNNNKIQDVGFIFDISDYNNYPVSGYIENDYLVAIEDHLYILYLTSKNKYVKIFIEKIGSYSSVTDDVKLWLIYEY